MLSQLCLKLAHCFYREDAQLSKCKKFTNRYIPDNVSIKEKSEQAYIPQTPPLLDNSTYNDSQGTHQIHKMIW